MAAHTDRGALGAPWNECADHPVIHPVCSDLVASNHAPAEDTYPPLVTQSVWKQFVRNLMVALGSLTI